MTNRTSAILLNEPIKSFLMHNKILPINKWNKFEIVHHKKIQNKEEISITKKMIGHNVEDRAGLYAYMKDDILLYVGKAKKLKDRIFSHYREAFYKSKKTDKAYAWYKFFSKYTGTINVYWLPIEGDRQRRIVEEMIELVEGTIFENEYPRGKRTIASIRKKQ